MHQGKATMNWVFCTEEYLNIVYTSFEDKLKIITADYKKWVLHWKHKDCIIYCRKCLYLSLFFSIFNMYFIIKCQLVYVYETKIQVIMEFSQREHTLFGKTYVSDNIE